MWRRREKALENLKDIRVKSSIVHRFKENRGDAPTLAVAHEKSRPSRRAHSSDREGDVRWSVGATDDHERSGGGRFRFFEWILSLSMSHFEKTLTRWSSSTRAPSSRYVVLRYSIVIYDFVTS